MSSEYYAKMAAVADGSVTKPDDDARLFDWELGTRFNGQCGWCNSTLTRVPSFPLRCSKCTGAEQMICEYCNTGGCFGRAEMARVMHKKAMQGCYKCNKSTN